MNRTSFVRRPKDKKTGKEESEVTTEKVQWSWRFTPRGVLIQESDEETKEMSEKSTRVEFQNL